MTFMWLDLEYEILAANAETVEGARAIVISQIREHFKPNKNIVERWIKYVQDSSPIVLSCGEGGIFNHSNE